MRNRHIHPIGSTFLLTVLRLSRYLCAGAVSLCVLALTACSGGWGERPEVVRGPANQSVIVGQTATFAVSASGTAPLSYQWSENGVLVKGATGTSYTTPPTTGSDNGAVFSVAVTNAAGDATSASATLIVSLPPVIVTPPANQTSVAGQMTTFNVMATGTAPLSYQWLRNGVPIAGATGNSYSVLASAADNGAVYTAVVSNLAGTVTTYMATLTVNVPPSFTLQPVSDTVNAGTAATFRASAIGTQPITYQWYRSGAAIPGATAISYTTSTTVAGDNGAAFTVVATNAGGTASSAVAGLTVNVSPTITVQPVGQTVISGQSATFNVSTTGTAPITYQWYLNGAVIAGATSNFYTTPILAGANSGGVYTVAATNVAGTIRSAAAALTVNVPPAISMQPVSQTVVAGQPALYSVAATGTAPLSYQWFLNGSPIAGATASTYATGATATGTSGAVYTVTVTNAAGTATSVQAGLTVNAPPAITVQPAGSTVILGQPATFFTAATGTAPLTYQWYDGGVLISGATSRYYTTPATVSANNSALYTVVVTNAAGSITSAAATLTVNTPPSITLQPISQTAIEGQPANFVVTANGTAPLTYQWLKNGAAIVGATSSTYATPAAVSGDTGALFTVTVANSAGTVTSSAATLTVNTPPTITVQPTSQTVIAPQAGTFSVVANGTAPLTYQWYKNGAPFGGATSNSFTTLPTATGDSGDTFTVKVTNAAGTVTSSVATLTVNVAPTIASAPMSEAVTGGQTASFAVAATGTAPLTYQWFKNGAQIGGATSSAYTTPAAVSGDTGALFTVSVTNVAGTVTSSAATLTVNTAPTISVQPTNQTVTAPQAGSFSVAASGTEPLSYQWYANGAAIPGATSSSYTTSATAAANNNTTYNVKVTNTAGSVTSVTAALTVYTTPLATAITCNASNPPYNSAITVTPTFSGGTAVVGSGGFGSSQVTSSAVNGQTYTTPGVNGTTTYTMTVTGSNGSEAANSCTVTPTPVLITPITPAAQTTGTSAQTFGATASGGATNNLTWTASGGTFSGNVWTPPNAAGTYTITATSVDEPSIHVTTTATISLPVITAQPVSKNACVGYNPSLAIGANYATGYQWSFGGSAVGTSTPVLSLNNVTASESGNYSCQVSNGAGSVTSNVVTVNVVSPTTLSITTQPTAVSVYATQTATFAVAASGTGTLKYQWYTGAVGSGTAINGATSSTYTTGALTAGASGTSYYATVTDPDCTDTTVTSTAATVTVSGTDTAVPPTIVTQPTAQTATVGGSASFSVTASGGGTLTYQWYRVPYSGTELTAPTAGTSISGATGSTYTVPSVDTAQSNDGDSYYVVVTNQYGSAVSNRVVLAVGAGILLQITDQPKTEYASAGTLASLSVGATCTGCIPAYQWYWYSPGSTTVAALNDGAASTGALSGATIAGATSSSITLQNVPSSASGAVFYVVVTSTSDGTTQIAGTNPLTSSTAAIFVGSVGTVGASAAGSGLCNTANASWVLNGTSPGTASGDVPYQNTVACTIELTNDQGTEHAAVYWPTLISTAKFSATFTVTLSASSTPADGFTMVLGDPSQGATTASLGTTGEGLGANGIPGFVLGFDTYQNGNLQGDPTCVYSNSGTNIPCDPVAVPYMAVGQGATGLWENPWSFVNGDLNTQNSTNYTPNEFANSTHTYVVTVVRGTMTVTMDGYELFTGMVSLPPAAYLGFTASTGGSSEAVTFSNLTATVSAP